MKQAAKGANPPSELDRIVSELEGAVAEYELQVEAGRIAGKKLEAARAAIAALRGEPPAAPQPRRRGPSKRPPAKGRAARPPKKAKATKRAVKVAPAKKAPKLAPDEPRVAKGRLPTKGVQMLVCEGADDRKKKVRELLDDGFKRAGAGHPLVPGMFDVRDTPDGATILWRPREEPA